MIKELEEVDPKIYIVANKKDLVDKRAVAPEQLISYASKEGLKFYEISAKDGTGIKEMFQEVCTDLLTYEPKKSPNKVYLRPGEDEEEEVEQESKCF